MRYYSTIESVLSLTGIKPDDLGIRDTESKKKQAILEERIEEWLIQVKDLIDQDRNRDYQEEVDKGYREFVPPGIHNIALRMVANMAAQAILRRTTATATHDDYSIRMTSDSVFTEDIRNDLSRYPCKPRFSIFRINNQIEEEI